MYKSITSKNKIHLFSLFVTSVTYTAYISINFEIFWIIQRSKYNCKLNI